MSNYIIQTLVVILLKIQDRLFALCDRSESPVNFISSLLNVDSRRLRDLFVISKLAVRTLANHLHTVCCVLSTEIQYKFFTRSAMA